ncbi:prolipoprotein diacylglyceryl transferase [Oharaeibacter diazotrophicus]|uniref:Phosphatidylglycerol--prolipoprotein diacylglyceryl transferase n=1 Tax=Oharaeibacter diazotrophicus TaxID=1920512 RepID=A0A4R6R9G0_9HYPH|nr:prolipoprotein diacylglyceryl transferase [Oharaeibacter diazotrophicus]TDP82619.1 phosphatidylglycerol:prolipoprotein diacylglycerol transferase [Oharaeibacter diazotrophicus]BBE72617.1 prolipoprotein diacylglyceryl transferase [Pleomorphomonas sp. SM30]GLS76651.1 prolipoprotein diacylglyceryl transferase [Oharaeibacter diazotrophicus]
MPILVIPFPAIDPILVSFGPFAIRWYALAYVAGLLFGWWYVRRLVATDRLWPAGPRMDALGVDDLLVWITFGVVLGGRLGYVAFYNLDYYLSDPLEIVKVWDGGMSFHGGMTGAALAMILFARGRKLNFWSVFDAAAAAVPIGLLLGRLANFVNGELYGRPTDVSWAVVFPRGGDVPRHPSQIYEAGLEGLVLFVVLTLVVWRTPALKRPGLVTGLFGVGYALARIVVEFFREPDPQVGYLAFDVVTMGMVLSAAMGFVGLAMIALAVSGRTAGPSAGPGP